LDTLQGGEIAQEISGVQQILVMNSKGGCGKTTVTTNLASYFAYQGLKTAIVDYDPQRSSLHWIKTRPPGSAEIYGADAAPQTGGALRSIKMYVPNDVQRVVIDAPAGVDRLVLQEMVRRADCIVIPVGPSSIDVHATADFIKDLFLVGRIRKHNTKVAVVANRVRSSMPVYEPLERFLQSLKLPFLTRISDADEYIMAVEQGMGLYDMDSEKTAQQRAEFAPLIEWLDVQAGEREPSGLRNPSRPKRAESTRKSGKVVHLDRFVSGLTRYSL
jgi:chromosome partitioning protein